MDKEYKKIKKDMVLLWASESDQSYTIEAYIWNILCKKSRGSEIETGMISPDAFIRNTPLTSIIAAKNDFDTYEKEQCERALAFLSSNPKDTVFVKKLPISISILLDLAFKYNVLMQTSINEITKLSEEDISNITAKIQELFVNTFPNRFKDF